MSDTHTTTTMSTDDVADMEADEEIAHVRWTRQQAAADSEEEADVEVATSRMVGERCSRLMATLVPGGLAYASCDLSHQRIADVTVLRQHALLRHVNVAHNQLMDVRCLGALPFLETLDASHNQLTRLLDFTAPLQLTHVNYAHNLVDAIGDLSAFWSLVDLDVSHNLIRRVAGIEQLRFIQNLNLASNFITVVDDFGDVPVQTLSLCDNRVVHIEQRMSQLQRLRRLDVSGNRLTTLAAIDDAPRLETLCAADNRIAHLVDVTYMRTNPRLRCVDLRGNAVCAHRAYRTVAMHSVRCLRMLDGERVSPSEKALTIGSCELATEMGRDAHAQLAATLRAVRADCVSLPPPPDGSVVVLVGPTATRKRELVVRCRDQCGGGVVVVGVAHTTRARAPHETDGDDFHFVSTAIFDALLRGGHFVTCVHHVGERIAIAGSEMARVHRGDGRTLLLRADLGAALQLRARYAHIRIVTTWPTSATLHRQWLLQHVAIAPWLSAHIAHAHRVDDRAQHGTHCAAVVSELVETAMRMSILDAMMPVSTSSTDEDASSSSWSRTDSGAVAMIDDVSTGPDITESSSQTCPSNSFPETSVEEEADDDDVHTHVESFISEQLNLRAVYERIFERNPGLRVAHIATDGEPQVMVRKLMNIITADLNTPRPPIHHDTSYIHAQMMSKNIVDIMQHFT